MKEKEVKISNKRNKKDNSLKAIALAQVFLMILEIFAFAFLMSSVFVLSSGSVSATGNSASNKISSSLLASSQNVLAASTPQSLQKASNLVAKSSDYLSIKAQAENYNPTSPVAGLNNLKSSQTIAIASLKAQIETANKEPQTIAQGIKYSFDETKGVIVSSTDSGKQLVAGYDLTANKPVLESSMPVADYIKDQTAIAQSGLNQQDYYQREALYNQGDFMTSEQHSQLAALDAKATQAQKAAISGSRSNAENAAAGGSAGGASGAGQTPATDKKAVSNEVEYSNPFVKGATYMQGGYGALVANLFEGVIWAGVAYGFIELIGKIFPSTAGNVGTALAQGVFVGIMAGKTVYGLFEKFGATNSEMAELSKDHTYTYIQAGNGKDSVNWFSANRKGVSIGLGILTAYLVFASNYKKIDTKQDSIEFKCLPWQAPTGGSSCNKCNTDSLRPCSEYRCKALGATCKLINAGTGFDKCIDASVNDVTSPGIKPMNVLPNGFSYSNVKPRPPGGEGTAGMTILGTGESGCIKAFTPFMFGIITTDKGDVTQPAQCKIDSNHTNKMDDMAYWMGGSNLFVENHSEQMSMPGVDNVKAQFPELNTNGDYTLYIRCRDGNGNENRDEFVVKFCVDKTPDNTAPQIITTSIPSNSPVQYKIDNVSINVYTNEPSNCKWSRRDASYNSMENNMTCSNNIWEMNAQMLYTCETQLTGVKDREENNFYFRCQDTSPQKNQMQQSYPFKLIGTQPLTILETGPTGKIGSSTSTATINLTVSTDNGFQNGEARCFYSTTKDDSGFIEMVNTGNTNTHSQPLDLSGGNYYYYFKCLDAGGNSASNETNFSVFVDKFAPRVVRAYSWESKLVIMTDEESACYYSTSSCNFDPTSEKGNNMPYDFDPTRLHLAEWKIDQSYYIKCVDKFGNTPEPSECSFIARPYQLVTEEYAV